MSSILITGAGPNGITGKLLSEHFSKTYNVLTPSSKELDLTNDNAVGKYFDTHLIDFVIHCATFRPWSINAEHLIDEELESNLRMFYSLASQSNKFKKMIYFGSGAEFDKSKDIISVREEDFGKSIPKNKYGLAKYIINTYTLQSDNIYNLRLFGTINKYERYDKNVVSNLCAKGILGLPLTLKQDCRFSFFSIKDIVPIIEYALTHELLNHDYNLVMDENYLLSDIAKYILKLSNSNKLTIEKEGLNLEYTASNNRLKNEIPIKLTPICEAISEVYYHCSAMREKISLDNIDNRWK